MHKISISPEAREFAERLRGGVPHMFGRVDPRRTALIVIDMQVGFIEPGAPVEVPAAREIVGEINALGRELRRAGGTVVFLRMTADEESRRSWSTWYDHFYTRDVADGMVQAFARGSRYWELWPQLDAQAQDLVIDKTRFGAFVPGASDLHERLQARGIDTLIITGTLTNCCCESTARDAMQMNYKLIFVSDANAAMSDAAHNATLDNMCMLFADVRPTAEVLQVLAESAPAVTTAA